MRRAVTVLVLAAAAALSSAAVAQAALIDEQTCKDFGGTVAPDTFVDNVCVLANGMVIGRIV
ncbi:hypothetical protein A8924_3160 [Saccharopolyspora erythraea NRRL 2338]|uniref:Uncharacterized protein n=2 Tax=Saccharopolyspora erythraea TaxID=1836 RepID=A4FDC4_SACEN|nr:hypothetical protein A8924_3160 [Saccharopolyspora erythraea NRRL 2338]QRK92380.1 hypothetical protein JQX30_14295 [Saccharopolyspora erythraea]CAM02049.1 hypothetical protein SACE_2768 [Saccharopolyspora erythraea NRRL 2338]